MALSLRNRLLLIVGAVIVAAVAAVGWISSRVTQVEFNRFQEHVRLGVDPELEPELLGVKELVSGVFREDDLVETKRVLREWKANVDSPFEAILLDDQNRLLAVSSVELESLQFQTPEDGSLIAEGIVRGELLHLALQVPFETLKHVSDDSSVRIYLFPSPLQSSVPVDEGEIFIGSVKKSLVLAVAGAGIIALIIVAVTSRRILVPIEELTGAAQKLRRGDLSQRVKIRRSDEIGKLAVAFNAMAEEIERTENFRRNMVSDTAHELRTPITNLRCQVEAIQDGVSKADSETMGSLHEEVLLLQRLVEDLQELALADAGQLQLNPCPLNLGEEIRAAIRALEASVAEPKPEVHVEVDPTLEVTADSQRLRQILTNILRNAFDHTPT